jgi:hypothetical protein
MAVEVLSQKGSTADLMEANHSIEPLCLQPYGKPEFVIRGSERLMTCSPFLYQCGTESLKHIA